MSLSREKLFDLIDCQQATTMTRSYIEHCRKVVDDADRLNRWKVQECQRCYYNGKVGGQMITHSKCKSCEKELQFPSTNVDRLCIECAREQQVCKHCGADMELKNRRKLR